MSIELRRRHFLAAGLGGAAGLALPNGLRAATMGRGFTHGVASGEPAQDSILLWTRFVGLGDAGTELVWEIAEDSEFGRIVKTGTARASAETDHCAKAPVGGLDPARWYFYRFRSPDGSVSAVGRTRTLPAEGSDPFRMAVFSCSNLPYGYFNAYAHAAGRQDIDLVLHLGDYLYEYPDGTYPAQADVVGGRHVDPATEMIRLADYHARYAVYRADRDLQRLHQLYPMIAIWDDHEFANDAWAGGAENHQPETEGPWAARKAAALAAHHHWLPMSDAPYAAYEIGELATLFRLETRITGRDAQIDLPALFAEAGSLEAGMARLHGKVWPDPARHMLGAEQERWLAEGLAASTRTGTRWQVLAQQVVMGSAMTPGAIRDWIDPAAPPAVQQRVAAAIGLAKLGIPSNLDAWGGYPAARARLLQSAQAADANLLVLAGDSHNSWAFDLFEGGQPAGAEFGVPSVTSPGFEAYFTRTDPAVVARGVVDSSPELVWADTAQRGYGHVTLTREEARCDWIFTRSVKQRSASATAGRSMRVQYGRNRLSAV